MNNTEQTTAQKIQFQLQFMGLMAMSGLAEECDRAYVKAQELVQELVDAGH